jgi:hypothetical protein
MPIFQKMFPVFLLSILPILTPHAAQAQQAKSPGFPDAPGKGVLLSKCYQCHNPSMWQDHRQDRKGWEGALYRMVGRGALWTEDEIKSMADYLAAVYGPEPSKALK